MHVGCERPHAYFIPYETKEKAQKGARGASAYFKSLAGEWNFKFYKSVSEVPESVTEPMVFTEKMAVPSSWQYAIGRGYDVPQYTNVIYPFPYDPPRVPEENPAAVYMREDIYSCRRAQRNIPHRAEYSKLQIGKKSYSRERVRCLRCGKLQKVEELQCGKLPSICNIHIGITCNHDIPACNRRICLVRRFVALKHLRTDILRYSS